MGRSIVYLTNLIEKLVCGKHVSFNGFRRSTHYKDLLCLRRRRTVRISDFSAIITDGQLHVMITGFSRNTVYIKVLRNDSGAPWILVADTLLREESGFRTYLNLDNGGRSNKRFWLQAFVDTLHNLSPNYLWIGNCRAALDGVVIETAPYRTGVVWCVTGPYRITVVGGRT